MATSNQNQKRADPSTSNAPGPKRQSRTANLAKSTPVFDDNPFADVLPPIDFGSSSCVICHKEDKHAGLLRLPCSHEIHPRCYPGAAKAPQACCPKCAKPIRYKICGHSIWHQQLPDIPPGANEFEGVCMPCGAYPAGRRRWIVNDGALPVFRVQMIARSYVDYIEAENYRLLEDIDFGDVPDNRPLERLVSTETAFPELGPIVQPVNSARSYPEERAAGARYTLWVAIGQKYSWNAPPEVKPLPYTSTVEIVAKYASKEPTSRGKTVDGVLRTYLTCALEAGTPEAIVYYKLLRTRWRSLEMIWLNMQRKDNSSPENESLALGGLDERDLRHAWVKVLHSATNALVLFSSLPEVRPPEGRQ
ncbi:hypothetical protein AB5N19_06353 [Seiridium cardinale]